MILVIIYGKPYSRHVLQGPEVTQAHTACAVCVCVYVSTYLSECEFIIKSDFEVTED